MADLTLNERISTWFEPKPSFIPVKPEPSSDFTEDWKSLQYFWMWDCWSQVWVSRYDFHHDEFANMRLLDAMPKARLEKVYIDSLAAFYWYCEPDGIYWGKFHADDKDRKAAIILAFCKFAGISVEEKVHG